MVFNQVETWANFKSDLLQMLFASNRHDSRRFRVQIYTFFLIPSLFRIKFFSDIKKSTPCERGKLGKTMLVSAFVNHELHELHECFLFAIHFDGIVCPPCSNRLSDAKALQQPRRVAFSASLSEAFTGCFLHVFESAEQC